MPLFTLAIAREARHVPADGQDVSAALRYTAAHARAGDVLLLDSLAGMDVDAGVIAVPGERHDGPRLWRSADEVMKAAAANADRGRAWVPVTHAADHVADLHGRAGPDGRVFRGVWTGRGTAVYLGEPAEPAAESTP